MDTPTASRRHRFIDRRRLLGYTQESLAEAVGVDATTVRRWETGRTTPRTPTTARIATALQLSFASTHHLLHPTPVDAVSNGLVDEAQWLSHITTPASTQRYRFGRNDVAQLEAVIARCKQLDAQSGSGAIYDLVNHIADATSNALRHHTFEAPTGRNMANAVAGIRALAGWVAFDQCHYSQAQRHLHAAERLTTATGHRLLRADVRYRQARLLQHLRCNNDAIDVLHLAGHDLHDTNSLGAAGAGMTITATLAASYAAVGQHHRALELMERAHSYLDAVDAHTPLDYGWHHPTELWAQYGRIYRDAARTNPRIYADDAIAWSSYALHQYPETMARSRAFGHVGLAPAQFLAGEPDTAMHTAFEARNSPIASPRLHDHLYWLRRDTTNYHDPRIDDFHRTLTTHTPKNTAV